MADPESQWSRLAPAGEKSDEQPSTIALYSKRKHQEASKAIVYVLATVVFFSTIFLIIASVFLRVVNPKLRLNTVTIQNFQFQNTNSANSTSSSLNITMLTEVRLNNQNFGRYVFENCNAVVLHGNSTIGGGFISGGRVGAKRTKSISVMMEIGSGNLNFSSEVMEIRSYAKMTGRVHVTKLVNRRKTIEMNCTINLNLTSRSVMNQLCS